MSASRAKLITILEQTQPELERLTAAISEAELDFRSAPEEWSIREILAHLVDDEMYVMRTRFERIMKEARPHLAPHDEKYWYANRNTARDAVEELLSDFAVQRAASLAMIHMLRESDWAREGYQPEYGHFTAEKCLASWAEHDTVHLHQIERNVQSARLSPHKS
ncbi:MAG TPA: DinB family protein [Ktedonosporobacter sp.]|nr:DinB family protein [Ktedonosporobacter sp.]